MTRAHPHLFGSTEFDGRGADDGVDSRFSPLRLRGTVVPVLYAGVDGRTAAAQTIFHTLPAGGRPRRIPLTPYLAWQWSEIHPTRDLSLLVVDRRHGATAATLVGGGRSTYPAARKQAARLLERNDSVDGLVWASRQLHDTPEQVVVDVEATAVSILLLERTSGRSNGVSRGELASAQPPVAFATPPGLHRLRSTATELDVTIVAP